MNFKDVLTWIIIIYVVYYLIVIVSDILLKKRVSETTGVDDYSVFKPIDNPHIEDPGDYISRAGTGGHYSEEFESDGGGSVAEKKNNKD
jgi:hypothetical protein